MTVVLCLKPAKIGDAEQKRLCGELLNVAIVAIRARLEEKIATGDVHVSVACVLRELGLEFICNFGLSHNHLIDPDDPSHFGLVRDIQVATSQFFPFNLADQVA